MDISKVFPDIIAVKQWRVRSSSDPKKLYLVEKMVDGSLHCDCVAGQFKRPCKHKNIIIKKVDKIA